MNKEIELVWVNEDLKEEYEELEEEKPELYKWLNNAFDDLKEDPTRGIAVPKKLIPEEYKKRYGIDNLWKYDLPQAWRLLYSLAGNKIKVITIILEWLDHKEYERKFNY